MSVRRLLRAPRDRRDPAAAAGMQSCESSFTMTTLAAAVLAAPGANRTGAKTFIATVEILSIVNMHH